jgi:hypothetical protein
MDKKTILKNIAASRRGIAAAEAHLAKVVGEVKPVARAQKMTISEVLDEAIKKLSAAKADLETLEKLALKQK